MAIIQFSNGQKVQFNGNPTPADIEEVAKNLNIQTQQPVEEQPQESKVGGFLKGVAKGVGSILKDIGDLGARGLRAIAPAQEIRKTQYTSPISQESVTPTTGAQKLGFGVEQIGELFIPAGKIVKPLEAVAKGSKIVSAAPKALKSLTFLARAAGGAVEMGASRALQTGGNIEETKNAALGGAIGEAIVGPILNGVIKVSGKLIKNIGKGLGNVAFPMSPETARIVQTYNTAKPTLLERIKSVVGGQKITSISKSTKPITEAETGFRFNLMGTERDVGRQAERAKTILWKNVIEPVLSKSKIKVNMRTFLSGVEQEIKSGTSELTERSAMLQALNKVKGDYKPVNNISLIKLQDYKSGWAKPIPESFYRGKPITGTLNKVREKLVDKAQQILYGAVDDGSLRQAYIDWGNLKSLSELGIKAVDPVRSKGATKQAWEFIVDTAITPVASIGGNVLYKTGKGIEFIGSPGLNKVGDILGRVISTNVIKDSSNQNPQ